MTIKEVVKSGVPRQVLFYNGEDGAQGGQGSAGANDNGIASTQLNEDYTLTLTFTNGTSYTTSSIRGEASYTSQRSTDHWTDADKAEIKAYIDEAILGGAW